MSDLVERLRDGEPCKWTADGVCKMMDARSGCICAEAADEIGRLRLRHAAQKGIAEGLRKRLDEYMHSPCNEHGCQAITLGEENRALRERLGDAARVAADEARTLAGESVAQAVFHAVKSQAREALRDLDGEGE